jgi:transposase
VNSLGNSRSRDKKQATLVALRKLLEQGQTDEVLTLFASLLDNLGHLSLEVGVDLPISTLTDWVAYCGDLLEPLVRRIGELALESHLLQSDDTGIKVVDQDSPNGTTRGHLWGHLGDRRWAYFDYTPIREAEGPYRYLKHRKGWLQVDAYSGYDRLFRGEQATAVEVGCWAHTRRYFFEVVQSGDHRAAIALDKIAKLYAVERKATEQSSDPKPAPS